MEVTGSYGPGDSACRQYERVSGICRMLGYVPVECQDRYQ